MYLSAEAMKIAKRALTKGDRRWNSILCSSYYSIVFHLIAYYVMMHYDMTYYAIGIHTALYYGIILRYSYGIICSRPGRCELRDLRCRFPAWLLPRFLQLMIAR